MKKKLILSVSLVLAVAVFFYVALHKKETAEHYRYTEIAKGDIEFVVSSTGTLKAVTTVQVGTQVSGIISEILADFNEQVKAGEVIAKIDTTLLEISVRDAQANLERSAAQLTFARQNFERIRQLYQQKIVTETEFIEAEYNFATAEAAQKSSAVNLEKAQRNLAYATIYAPISGTVIERNVDVGQTVAASFSAPQLFLIANDLTRMQIEVAVDESDIGLIRQGQVARFSVQAFPEERFIGAVRQVRLQSKVAENVVSYTVIVDVDNKERKLLPGMTATVDFVIEKAVNVFKIANPALRFRPTQAMLDELRKYPQTAGVAERAKREQNYRDRLWYFNNDNRLSVIPVKIGISDGQMTEINAFADAHELTEGMQVIMGVVRQPLDTASNPFQNASPSRRRGGF